MPTTIDTVKTMNYERFEANRRFEEMTDIAERLGYPIDTTIQYGMKNGAAYCTTDTVDRPFHNQTFQALQYGESAFQGDQAFEAERLRLEHQEALLVDAFGRGELGGDVLVKVSKIPDAVVEGTTSIKGYRRDLLRSFVRIYRKTPEGVECRLFTLDHNSRAGLQAVGEILGIDTLAASEEVLAKHSVIQAPFETSDFVDELIDRVKLVYDTKRYEETGQRSYAGSIFVDKQNAMHEISKQPQFINQHMQAISEIMRLGRDEDRLEQERRNTAAAIKLSSQGVALASSGDSSVAAEVQSGNYDRECATATSVINGMNQAQVNLVENIWKHGECQVCFAKTMVGSCKVCAACANADDRGVDLLKLREQNIRAMKRSQSLASISLKQIEHSPLSSRRQATMKENNSLRTRKRVVIGGAVVETYDPKTEEVVSVT